MAEITIDQEPVQDSEFSPEEQEALQVGEQLQQLDNELLAGKYANAQELEKAYMELQGKFSSGEREEPKAEEPQEEPEEEVKEEKEEPAGDNILDTLFGEMDEGPSKETIEQLSKMDPQDVARLHVQYRMEQEKGAELSQDSIDKIQASVGGAENYQQILGWAKDTLSDNEIGMYDAVMEKGEPLACFFAAQALAGRYMNSQGFDGEVLTGKAAKAAPTNTFRSQAEVVEAMKDSRYENDPAYRQDVFDKLEQSNIQY